MWPFAKNVVCSSLQRQLVKASNNGRRHCSAVVFATIHLIPSSFALHHSRERALPVCSLYLFQSVDRIDSDSIGVDC